MSSDSLVFDMSSQSEGTPSVFVRKDWLSILDNNNGQYNSNQIVIDTSQLSNSSKYLDYRQAYLTMPLLLTLTSPVGTAGASFAPQTPATSADYALGLKNWYGTIIHSFTLDYNGTTIIQQTPYISLINNFRLMTSLSVNDLVTQGAQIGFYPDVGQNFSYSGTASPNGIGISNNVNAVIAPVVTGVLSTYGSSNGGFLKRQQAWNYNPNGFIGNGAGATFSAFTNAQEAINMWKSYIFTTTPSDTAAFGVWQCQIIAQIKLKHIASFFERVPLLKGVFMKLTFNVNQCSVVYTVASAGANPTLALTNVTSPLGGVNPLMIASAAAGSGGAACYLANGAYQASISVGSKCLNTQQLGTGTGVKNGYAVSVQLNVPAYTFNSVYESSYLSSPIKKIVYSDYYQYQIINQIGSAQTFNQLITNGIANIKSVLVLPFLSASQNGNYSPLQSPFAAEGGGATSPLIMLTQFNVQISGQNAIYNTERYSWEQFSNQLYGANSVNGGLTDGMCSGLVGQLEFETGYGYYYVNCGRMLPVEEAVPKSVNILGTNQSSVPVDLYIFVEYGVEVSLDILTGARV